MHTVLRHIVLGLSAATLSAGPLAAQWYQSASVLTAPTFTTVTFGSGATQRSTSQVAIPVAVLLPFGERLMVDVSTAFATSSVVANDSTASEISGQTDTQIRAAYRLPGDKLLLTLGITVPTGQYGVATNQLEAAGQIGNDFLYFPISSMGNGQATTAGLAYARPLGTWNLGLGLSARKSTEFAVFADTTAEYRFTPADEYRLTMSVDRPVGDGALSAGLTYSSYGDDVADGTTSSTGDRILANAGWNFKLLNGDVFLSGWNLYHLKGEIVGGTAPAENVFSVSGAFSFPMGEYLLQPSVETRLWQVGGARAGNVVNLGFRLSVPLGNFGLFPQLGYSLGNVYSLADGSATKASGFRASLTLRIN